MKTFSLWPFQDIENQLAIKSKALDELRQNYLTLESGTVPLLEDTASKIDELFQEKCYESGTRIHSKCTISFQISFFILFVVYW